MKALNGKDFERSYTLHQRHLKLKGLQPKSVEAYSRAIRRIGARFDARIDHLTEQQLAQCLGALPRFLATANSSRSDRAGVSGDG